MARFDAFSTDFEHPFINSSPDYSSRNGSYGSRAIGEMTNTASFRDRSKRLRNVDNEKNQLIDDLIYQLEMTEKALEQTRLDHTRETHFNREVQQREITLQDQLNQVKQLMDRDPYILLLIDGDSTVFTNELLRKGEKGGDMAAEMLLEATNAYINECLPQLKSPKIVVRIYSNMKELGRSLRQAGAVTADCMFGDFVRGFNSANLTFEMIDSGSQKDRTMEKICEYFKVNLYNCHCHQVIFGCIQNSEYAKMLQEVIKQPQVVEHITLLETVPFDGDLGRMRHELRTTKFDGIFRPTRLVLPHQPKGPLHTVTAQLPALTRVESNGTTATGSTPTTPALTWASLTATPFVPAAQKPLPTAANPPEPAAPRIDRNKFGQRIDKLDPSIPREEVQRIKKLKLCNVHFLLGADACTNQHCTHDHTYPLSRGERKVLNEVARMTPCYYQTECDDPRCIYGHRCPQSEPDKKDCWYKENCRFWGWGHGIDTRAVKTTRV